MNHPKPLATVRDQLPVIEGADEQSRADVRCAGRPSNPPKARPRGSVPPPGEAASIGVSHPASPPWAGILPREPFRLSGGHQDAERVPGGIGKHEGRFGRIRCVGFAGAGEPPIRRWTGCVRSPRQPMPVAVFAAQSRRWVYGNGRRSWPPHRRLRPLAPARTRRPARLRRA